MPSECTHDCVGNEPAKEHCQAGVPCPQMVAGLPSHEAISSACKAGKQAEVRVKAGPVPPASLEREALNCDAALGAVLLVLRCLCALSSCGRCFEHGCCIAACPR